MVNYSIGKFTILMDYTNGMRICWKPKFPKTKNDNSRCLNHLIFSRSSPRLIDARGFHLQIYFLNWSVLKFILEGSLSTSIPPLLGVKYLHGWHVYVFRDVYWQNRSGFANGTSEIVYLRTRHSYQRNRCSYDIGVFRWRWGYVLETCDSWHIERERWKALSIVFHEFWNLLLCLSPSPTSFLSTFLFTFCFPPSRFFLTIIFLISPVNKSFFNIVN